MKNLKHFFINELLKYFKGTVIALLCLMFIWLFVPLVLKTTIIDKLSDVSLEDLFFYKRMSDYNNNNKINKSGSEKSSNNQISIILVDEESIRQDARLSKSIPYTRSYIADLINKLSSNKKNLPSTIAVDFYFPDHSNPVEDQKLSKALISARKKGINIVLGTIFVKNNYLKGEKGIKPIKEFLTDEYDGTIFTGYADYLDSRIKSKIVDTATIGRLKGDKPNYTNCGDYTKYDISFPLAIVLSKTQKKYRYLINQKNETQYKKLILSDINQTFNKHDFCNYYLNKKKRVNFIADKNFYSINSAYEILNNNKLNLKNKIVIIGAGYETAPDRFNAPIAYKEALESNVSLFSGPEIVAYTVYNIQHENFLKELSNFSLYTIFYYIFYLLLCILFVFKIKSNFIFITGQSFLYLVYLYIAYYNFDTKVITPAFFTFIITLVLIEKKNAIDKFILHYKNKDKMTNDK